MSNIQGKWKFNAMLDGFTFDREDAMGTMFITEYVNFTSNGNQYTQFDISGTYNTTHTSFMDYGSGGAPIYDGSSWYSGEEYRTIDFGTEPQTVSDEFYNFFVANARCIAEIKGKWMWNESISILLDQTEYVVFEANGSPYTKISTDIQSSIFVYGTEENSITVYEEQGDVWISDVYRTIDFGTEPQEVSDEFYAWFIANAKLSIADLTGYTVTVPAGWTVPAWRSFYKIIGTIIIEGISYRLGVNNTFNSSFIIGSKDDGINTWDSCSFYDSDLKKWGSVGSDEEFTLQISSISSEIINPY
jgi:hypothetical protein